MPYGGHKLRGSQNDETDDEPSPRSKADDFLRWLTLFDDINEQSPVHQPACSVTVFLPCLQ